MAARYKSIKGLNEKGNYTSVNSAVVSAIPQFGGSQTFGSSQPSFTVPIGFPTPQSTFTSPFFGAAPTPTFVPQPVVFQTQVAVAQPVKINLVFTQFPDFRNGVILLNSKGTNFVQIERRDGDINGSVSKFMYSHGLTGKISSYQFKMVIHGEKQYTCVITNTTPFNHRGQQFISNLVILQNLLTTQFVRTGVSNVLVGSHRQFLVSDSCFDVLHHLIREISLGKF